MGLFDNTGGFDPEFRTPQAFRLPMEASAFMARPILQRIIGSPLNTEAIARRASEIHLHQAAIGAETIEHGAKRGDDHLVNIGEAMIAAAVVKAENSRHVPPAVASKVVAMALDNNIDPASNPLIHDNHASQIADILDRHS